MKKAVGIKELAEAVADSAEISRTLANQVIRATFLEIQSNVEKGVDVNIREFGTFFKRHKTEQNYRHPATGKMITVPAHDSPEFSVSDKWRKTMRAIPGTTFCCRTSERRETQRYRHNSSCPATPKQRADMWPTACRR